MSSFRGSSELEEVSPDTVTIAELAEAHNNHVRWSLKNRVIAGDGLLESESGPGGRILEGDPPLPSVTILSGGGEGPTRLQ